MKKVLVPVLVIAALGACSKSKNELQPKLGYEARSPINTAMAADIERRKAEAAALGQPASASPMPVVQAPGFIDMTGNVSNNYTPPEVFVNQNADLGTTPGAYPTPERGIPQIPMAQPQAPLAPAYIPQEAQTFVQPAAPVEQPVYASTTQTTTTSSTQYNNLVQNASGTSRPTTLSDYDSNGKKIPASLMPGYQQSNPLNYVKASEVAPSYNAAPAYAPAPVAPAQLTPVSSTTRTKTTVTKTSAAPAALPANVVPSAASTAPTAPVTGLQTTTQQKTEQVQVKTY